MDFYRPQRGAGMKCFQLCLSIHREDPHVTTTPQDMFTIVHPASAPLPTWGPRSLACSNLSLCSHTTIGKWAVNLRLKGLLMERGFGQLDSITLIDTLPPYIDHIPVQCWVNVPRGGN